MPSTYDERLTAAIAQTRDYLLAQQNEEGYWVGELEGDTILESEYILLLAFLDREKSEIATQAANYILKKQLPEGGWVSETNVGPYFVTDSGRSKRSRPESRRPELISSTLVGECHIVTLMSSVLQTANFFVRREDCLKEKPGWVAGVEVLRAPRNRSVWGSLRSTPATLGSDYAGPGLMGTSLNDCLDCRL